MRYIYESPTIKAIEIVVEGVLCSSTENVGENTGNGEWSELN